MFKIFAILGALALWVIVVENNKYTRWQMLHGLGTGLVMLAIVVVLIAIVAALIVAANQTI